MIGFLVFITMITLNGTRRQLPTCHKIINLVDVFKKDLVIFPRFYSHPSDCSFFQSSLWTLYFALNLDHHWFICLFCTCIKASKQYLLTRYFDTGNLPNIYCLPNLKWLCINPSNESGAQFINTPSWCVLHPWFWVMLLSFMKFRCVKVITCLPENQSALQ